MHLADDQESFFLKMVEPFLVYFQNSSCYRKKTNTNLITSVFSTALSWCEDRIIRGFNFPHLTAIFYDKAK